jgi:hypothetical protein
MWRESGVNPGNPSGCGGAGLQLVGGENAEHWEELKSIMGGRSGFVKLVPWSLCSLVCGMGEQVN